MYAFLINSISFTDIEGTSTHEQLLQTIAHQSIQPQMQVQTNIAAAAPPPPLASDLSMGTKAIAHASLGNNPVDLSSFSGSTKDMTEAQWKESKCINSIIFLSLGNIFRSVR